MKWLITGVGWAVCGTLSYGLVFHYYQKRFRCFGWPARRWHYLASAMAAICGPIGFLHRLLLDMDDTDKTPWRLRYRTVTPDESWDDYHQRFPSLSKGTMGESSYMSNPRLRAVNNDQPHSLDLARQCIAAFRLDREKGEKPLPTVNIVDSGAPLLRADDTLRYDDHDRRLGRKV